MGLQAILKGQSLISAYRSLAITGSTSGFEKLSTLLYCDCFFYNIVKTKVHENNQNAPLKNI